MTERLLEGLYHFQTEVFEANRQLFEKLALGQQPEILFITCSDSRISPTLLTQTGPGELFILRNAGNLIPPFTPQGGGEAATIEYAVQVLGVKHIVVCGHSDCGAMKALFNHPENLEDLPAVKSWLAMAEPIKRIVKAVYPDRNGVELIDAAIEENVRVQMENLHTHPSVAAAIRQGKLHISGWVYNIRTGQVLAYEPAIKAFQSALAAWQTQTGSFKKLPPRSERPIGVNGSGSNTWLEQVTRH